MVFTQKLIGVLAVGGIGLALLYYYSWYTYAKVYRTIQFLRQLEDSEATTSLVEQMMATFNRHLVLALIIPLYAHWGRRMVKQKMAEELFFAVLGRRNQKDETDDA